MSDYPEPILNPADVRRRIERLERATFGPDFPALQGSSLPTKPPKMARPSTEGAPTFFPFPLPPLDVIQGKRKEELCPSCDRPEWECGDPLCDREPPEPPKRVSAEDIAIGPRGSPFPAAEECPHCGGVDLAKPVRLADSPGSGWMVCLDCSGGKVGNPKKPEPAAMEWSSLPIFPRTDRPDNFPTARHEAKVADAKILDIMRARPMQPAPTVSPQEAADALGSAIHVTWYLAEQEGLRGNSAGFEAFARLWVGLLMTRNYLQATPGPGTPGRLKPDDQAYLKASRDEVNSGTMEDLLTSMYG